MIRYLFYNYFPFFFGATTAVLVVLWSIQEKYNVLKFFPKNKKKRFFIDILVSSIVAFPTAFIIGNSTLKTEKLQSISRVQEFHSLIIEKVKKTDATYCKEGYGSSIPRDIPFPLLLSEYDFVNYKAKYGYILNDMQRIFSPQVCQTCAEPFEIISHPHSSLFKVETIANEKGYLVNDIAYTDEHLKKLLASLKACSALALAESSYIYLPKHR